jgi:predicted dehydrogenase
MPGDDRRLRWGLVGGGQGSFFGQVHRMAARLDGCFELVAGAFSTSDTNNRETGAALSVDPARIYSDFTEMARVEAGRPDGIQIVTVTLPNHLHFAAAKAFLENGIPVLCEKPMTRTLAEAAELCRIVEASGLPFIVAYTYTGYPMVREARRLVAQGMLGAIRIVQVEYAQDWLAADAENQGSKQAEWRVDPARSGAGGSLGDIGTHGFNLMRMITGLRPTAVAADLHSFGAGRILDDNAHVMMRLEGGAKAMLWASQVAIGRKNALTIRMFGEQGALEWAQEQPERLRLDRLGGGSETIVKGDTAMGRLPAGHPEGVLEALAQLYVDAAMLIRARAVGLPPPPSVLQGVSDGLEGLQFIEAAVESSRRDGAWIAFPPRVAAAD